MTQREDIHRLIERVSDDRLEAVKASIAAHIADQQDVDQVELEETLLPEEVTANRLYERFCEDWGRLFDQLNKVEQCLFPKQKFIDILLRSKSDRSLFMLNINARRAMSEAVRELVLLLQYSDQMRSDFELDEGFQFKSGAYSVFFEFLGAGNEEGGSQTKLE